MSRSDKWQEWLHETGAGTPSKIERRQRQRDELGYEIFGEGEPLLLLHGGLGSVEMFGPNIQLLAAHRRVIGVDLQSHGRSPAADRPMRWETMADDVAALVDQLDLEQAAIMGFSLGGGVALRTAIQHAALVERLILVSAVFKRQGWYPEMTAIMDAMGPETTPTACRPRIPSSSSLSSAADNATPTGTAPA